MMVFRTKQHSKRSGFRPSVRCEGGGVRGKITAEYNGEGPKLKFPRSRIQFRGCYGKMNQEFDRMLGEGDFLIFYFSPPSRRNVKGSSPLYFPVIDQPSALTSQRTDGVLQLRFECCFVLKSITRDKESSAKNRVFSARIAHQIIFRTHIKRAWFSRKPPVKKERGTQTYQILLWV